MKMKNKIKMENIIVPGHYGLYITYRNKQC